MKYQLSIFFSIAMIFMFPVQNAGAEGDPERGKNLFSQCIACHSMTPGEHLTGPSLAGVVGRDAGSVEGFGRYSQALKQSGITWTDETLGSWLKAPEQLVPGTSMRIRGIADPIARQDIVAFLETADASSGAAESGAERGAGMMGGTGGSRLVNLKEQSARQQVAGMRYCGDAYFVTLGTGETFTFWEFNLRFKTDSSKDGPPRGKPAILRSGMQGDRAFVIFANPGEISEFIRNAC